MQSVTCFYFSFLFLVFLSATNCEVKNSFPDFTCYCLIAVTVFLTAFLVLAERKSNFLTNYYCFIPEPKVKPTVEVKPNTLANKTTTENDPPSASR